MAGYTRQESGNIVTGLTIEASHINNELDAIVGAFSGTTGHAHDGSTGSGPLINLSTSVTGTLAVTKGGTGGATASAARTSLGLEIGTDVQAYDATLSSISSLGTASDKMLYTTGVDTWAETAITSFARTILDDTNATTVRTTIGAGTGDGDLLSSNNLDDLTSASTARSNLGLVIGTNVQAWDADLDAIAALASTGVAVRTTSNTWAQRTLTGTMNRLTISNGDGVSGNPTFDISTSYVGQSSITTLGTITTGTWNASTISILYGGTGATTASGARTALGLAIGTDVQAYDADTLKADTSDDLTAGFTSTSQDQGTKSSGTFTPSFATGNIQHCTNGGAFTLGVPSGHGTMTLDITNNASAGTITTSAFDIVAGDSFTTTNAHAFSCFIKTGNVGSVLNVVAMQ